MDSEIQARIRRVVSTGEFGKASALWEIYADQVAGEIRSGSYSAAQLAAVSDLIEWTRAVVICARAQAERRIHTQLTKLHAAAIYGRPLH